MSHLLNSTTDINLRAKKLRADEIEIYDEATGEFVPVVPGGGSGDTEVPSYAQPTLIDFGEKRMKINQSHLEVGDVGSAMRKTEVKASGLDVTDDAGNNAKIEGGAIYYKKASLEGEEENPTVTMAYEDIGEVVDKIKPIDYLNNSNINFSDKGAGYRIVLSETSSNTGLQMKSNLLQIGPKGAAVSGIRAYLQRDYLKFTGATPGYRTEYRNKEVELVSSDVTRTLMLEDIADSQTNYLKTDKIEFANGSGLSSAGLSYKIGDVVYTKTIREIAEMAQPYIRETGIDFRPPGDNDSMNITNINGSTVNTNTLALAAPYTDPEYENAYFQSFLKARQFEYTDPETGLIYAENKDIINVTNNLKDADYLKSDTIEFVRTANNTSLAIFAGGTALSQIAPASVRLHSNKNSLNSNYSALSSSSLTLYGAPSSNRTLYEHGTISNFVGANGKTLNLRDIMDSQTNYLKTERIEFADGSGLSQGLLHYVDDSSDLQSVSIKDLAESGGGGGATYPYLKSNHIELSTEDGGPYPITVNKTGSSLLTRISNESVQVRNHGNGSNSALYPARVQINRTGGGYSSLSSTSIEYKDSSSEPTKWADVSDIIDVANDFKNVSADYVYPMKTYDILFNGSTTAKSGYTTCGPAAEGVTALYPMMNIMALYAFQNMNNDIAFNFEGRVMLTGNYAFTGTAGVNKQRTYSFEVTVPGVHLPKFTLDQIILGDDNDNSSSPSGRVYQNLMVRHVNMPTFQRLEGITNSVWKFSFQLYNSSSSNIEVGHMLMRFRLILHIKERLDGSGMIEV